MTTTFICGHKDFIMNGKDNKINPALQLKE